MGQAPNPGPLSEWSIQKKGRHKERHGPRSDEAAYNRMQHVSSPSIIIQGRNKKGSNLVTRVNRMNWRGITFQPGEDAVSGMIQTTFNKCPTIVQEILGI